MTNSKKRAVQRVVGDDTPMEGEGIVGDLTLKAFKVLANGIRKFIKGARKLEDGELHFLGANYLGPGTKIEKYKNVKPLNRPDAVARQHDLDFFEIDKKKKSGKLTAEEAKEEIRKADNKMIRALKEMGKLEGIEEAYRQAGLRGIQFKRKIENVSPSFAKMLLPENLLGKKRSPQKGGVDTPPIPDEEEDEDIDYTSDEERRTPVNSPFRAQTNAYKMFQSMDTESESDDDFINQFRNMSFTNQRQVTGEQIRFGQVFRPRVIRPNQPQEEKKSQSRIRKRRDNNDDDRKTKKQKGNGARSAVHHGNGVSKGSKREIEKGKITPIYGARSAVHHGNGVRGATLIGGSITNRIVSNRRRFEY